LFMGEPRSHFTHGEFAEHVVDVLLASRETLDRAALPHVRKT